VIPVETVPGIWEGGIKEQVEEVNSSMAYMTHCKNLCKCHKVPPTSTTTKEKKEDCSSIPVQAKG
jgi:hypothetical protein